MKKRKTPRILTLQEENEIVSLYQDGFSSVALSRKFDIATATVSRVLKDFGIQMRSVSEASALRANLSPGGSHQNGRYGVFQSKKMGKWIPTASTYEYMRMQQLEEDPDVLSFDRCKDRIAYSLSGKTHHYTPDLVVIRKSGATVVEEIKPSSLTHRTEVRAKAAAATDHYSASGAAYTIVTEIEIGERYIASFDWGGIAALAKKDLDEWQKQRTRERGAEWMRNKRKMCPPTEDEKVKHAARTRDYMKRWMENATDEQKAAKRAKAAAYKRDRLKKLKAANDNRETKVFSIRTDTQ